MKTYQLAFSSTKPFEDKLMYLQHYPSLLVNELTPEDSCNTYEHMRNQDIRLAFSVDLTDYSHGITLQLRIVRIVHVKLQLTLLQNMGYANTGFRK